MAIAIARFIESVKLYYWFTLTDFREHLSDAYDTLLDKSTLEYGALMCETWIRKSILKP